MKLALDYVMEKYQDSVFKAALYILKDRYDAEDITQETFLAYHNEKGDFDGEEHIKAWLLRVAINKSKNLASTFWRKKRENIDDYIESLIFETTDEGALLAEVLRLPKKCRIIIHLFYYEDYSIKEIARLLDIKENTVKSQLNRGRNILKKRVEAWKDEE